VVSRVPKSLRAAARDMLEELEAGWLEVIKVRTEDGWKRVVCNRNAEWYRHFCADHLSHRHGRFPRPRTYIKRGATMKALARLIAGETNTIYAQRLLPYAYQYTAEHRRRTKEPKNQRTSVLTPIISGA